MVKLRIDGIDIEALEGMAILEAARLKGIDIPALCYHPKLSPYGGCRLCIVEIKGMPRPVTACTTTVSEGMEVRTTSPYIERLRKTNLDLLLSDHPYDCMVCQKAGECDLQDLAYQYGIREPRFKGERRIYTKRDGNPFIERDMEKCILCGKCVRICDEVQGVSAIDFAYRGLKTKVCPPFERDLDCEFCGQCVMVCPTGSLVGKNWIGKGRARNVGEVNTTCPYCGVGCSLTLHIKDNKIIRVSSKEDSVVNEGMLCAKGRFGYDFVASPDRLKTPLIKRNGRFEPVSWDEALDYISKRLKEIKEKYGPDAIGGLSSARCTNEENYLFQKFMRAAIGTNNIDHCARH
jgi:predicted molibdopterin-dependent oxidoreductase YjgC